MANKYHARKVALDGYVFDSGAEARRYQELLLMQRSGMIWDIAVHPVYPLEVDGLHITNYEADFRYRLRDGNQIVVEDVKGVKTDVYRIKRRLMKVCYGIDIVEVEA